MFKEHQLFVLCHLTDRSRFQKRPLFAAFQRWILRAAPPYATIVVWPLYSGGTMRMKLCGRVGAIGTAQVGMRQGCLQKPFCLASSSMTSTASSSQIPCQQVLSAEAPAFPVCSIPMTVHYSRHPHRICRAGLQAFILCSQWPHHQHSQDKGCALWTRTP